MQASELDFGMKHFTTSDGEIIDSPEGIQEITKIKLAKLNRNLSHKKKGSNSRKRAIKRLAKLHDRIVNQRSDFSGSYAMSYVNIILILPLRI